MGPPLARVPHPPDARLASAAGTRLCRARELAGDSLHALDFLLGFLQPKDWIELLRLEKKRRGVTDATLVFVGAANLARIAWCPMQAVRRSRVGETGFFGSYLEDRLEFAIETGRVASLPHDRNEWLQLAATDVPFAHVERVWLPDLPARLTRFSRGIFVEEGERSWYEPIAPRIRWHFTLERYVVVAEPDGLSRTEVFETKSPRSDYLARYQRPIADLQADIYGYLFGRRTKLLGEAIGNGPLSITERPVAAERAVAAVRSFARVDAGWVPPPPNEVWKCRNCEVQAGCPISRVSTARP